MKLDGSKNTLVTKGNKNGYLDLTVVGDWIFYKSGGSLYRIKTDGSLETQVTKG